MNKKDWCFKNIGVLKISVSVGQFDRHWRNISIGWNISIGISKKWVSVLVSVWKYSVSVSVWYLQVEKNQSSPTNIGCNFIEKQQLWFFPAVTHLNTNADWALRVHVPKPFVKFLINSQLNSTLIQLNWVKSDNDYWSVPPTTHPPHKL